MRLPIVLPDGRVKQYWDAIMFLVIFYSCNITPIMIASPPHTPKVLIRFRRIDFYLDLMFLFDTLSGFVYAFVDSETDELVTQRKAIYDAYTASVRLKLNIIAVIPIIMLPTMANKFLGHGICKIIFRGSKKKSIRIARQNCMKVGRLFRMSRIFLFFSQLAAVRTLLANSGLLVLNEASFRMIQIFVTLVFLCTTGGSMYFYLACNDYDPLRAPMCAYGDSRNSNSWIKADAIFTSGDTAWTNVVSRYIHFMVQSLFTIGYGDSVAPISLTEIKFSIVIMLMGAVTYALVIANMTSVLANANVFYQRHQDDLATVNQVLDSHRAPDGLRSRIKLCFEYLWSKQGGMLDARLLSQMPIRLQGAVAMDVRTQLLGTVPFFASTSRDGRLDFAQAAASDLDTRIDIPYTTVVFAHEKQRELFLIRLGKLMVYSTKMPAALGTLSEGDYFGDIQLVLDLQHPVAIKTGASYVESFILRHAAFVKLCERFQIVVSKTDPGIIATIDAYKERLQIWRQVSADAAAMATDDGMRPLGTKNTTIDGKLTHACAMIAAQIAIQKQSERQLIYPESKFHLIWKPLLFFLGCYTVLIVPVRTMLYTEAWKNDSKCGIKGDLSLIADYIVDIVFMIDVYLRAKRYVTVKLEGNHEELVTKPSEIFNLYAKSPRCKYDIIGTLPWLLFAPVFDRITKGTSSRLAFGCAWYNIMRYPHLIRGFQLAELLYEYRDYMDQVHGIVVKDKIIAAALRTYETVFLLIYASCFWAVVRGHGGSRDNQSFVSAFLRSTYFSLVTFTTVGYGDIAPESVSETWFAIVSGALGATFFAGIVANITSFVEAVDISDDNISHRRLVMQSFLTEQGLVANTRAAVLGYIDYVEAERSGLCQDSLLVGKFLPPNVRDDVTAFIRHRRVLACNLFRGASTSFLRTLMLELDETFHANGTDVVVQDVPVDGMFFVVKGEIILIIDNDQVASLSTNDVFAEGAILVGSYVSPYSARCTEYTELLFLDRYRFEKIISRYPAMKAKLPDMAKLVQTYVDERSPPSSPSSPDIRYLRYNNSADTSVSLTSSLQESLRSRMQSNTIHPASAFARIWAVVILFLVLRSMLLVPFKAAFLSGYFRGDFLLTSFYLDYVGDIILLMDILLRCRYFAYVDGTGRAISRRELIFKHYYDSGRFLLHVFASLPLDMVCLAYTSRPESIGKSQFRAFWRMNKLLRFIDIFTLIDQSETALASLIKVNKHAMRLVQLILAMLVSAHVFACVFFVVANEKGGPLACDAYQRQGATEMHSCLNWAQARAPVHPKNLLNVAFYENLGFDVDPLGVLKNTSSSTQEFGAWGTRVHKTDKSYDISRSKLLWKQYINSLYWGVATITTVGYGDVSAQAASEILTSIVCLLLSVVVYTLIVGNLEDIVGNLDVTTTLYHLKREQVKQYCNRAYLPELLRASIIDYFEKMWSQQKGVTGASLLRMLPTNLRSLVVSELAESFWQVIPYIDQAPKNLIGKLCLVLSLELYIPANFLFHAGECAWNLFFVVSGTAKLFDESSGKTMKQVSRASVGRNEFFLRVVYSASCQVTDYSQVLILNYDDMWEVLSLFGHLEQFRNHVIDIEKSGGFEEKNSNQSPARRRSRCHDWGSKLESQTTKIIVPTRSTSRSSWLSKSSAIILKHTSRGESLLRFTIRGLFMTEIDRAVTTLDNDEKFVVDPSSTGKRVWDTICLCIVLYFLFSVPYEIAFARAYKVHIFWIDISCTYFFLINTFLSVTLFAIKQQGALVTEAAEFRAIYVKSRLFFDFCSIAPLSLCLLLLSPGRFANCFDKLHYSPWINILRLVQLLHIRQLRSYATSAFELFQHSTHLNINGDIIYLLLLLGVMVLLCHWLACFFYFLGRYELHHVGTRGREHRLTWTRWFKDEATACARYEGGNIWICDDGIADLSGSHRWLIAFYWALYTASTIGYGSVKIKSNAEKMLCILAMILGAVVGDAGITAVLTAFIEHKDRQSGTNKRRMECATRMMTAERVNVDIQSSVIDFFEYFDITLSNVDEQTVLSELNPALRNQILHRAAHNKLCDSISYGAFEASVLSSLVYQMRAVIAVPSECILRIGQPDPSLYLFQSGVAHSVDTAGDQEFIASGTILSNLEFKQVAKRVGVASKEMTIEVLRARGLPVSVSTIRRFCGASLSSSYIETTLVSKTVFGQSVKTCRTKVRKYTCNPEYMERFRLKTFPNTETVTVAAIRWRRGLAGQIIGSADVSLKDKENKQRRWHSLRSETGKKVGEVLLSCQLNDLEKSHIASSAEVTVIADSFCHLFLLDYNTQESFKKYVKGLRLPFEKRIKTTGTPIEYRLTAEELKDLSGGDEDMSLDCENSRNSRGFEAYISETFKKISAKGSVAGVVKLPPVIRAQKRRHSSQRNQPPVCSCKVTPILTTEEEGLAANLKIGEDFAVNSSSTVGRNARRSSGRNSFTASFTVSEQAF